MRRGYFRGRSCDPIRHAGANSAATALRSDNGMVFTSRRFTEALQGYGIKREFITPHTPRQNCMIDRLFRTMREQCILLHNFKFFEEA
jgi:putative transposase